MNPIRVLIADDHAVVRRGIRHILETTPDLKVVAEAGDGGELLEKLRKEPFDVLLMDVTMPATNPVELIARLKAIARQLHLSPKTASTYKTRIMEKLNLKSDAELIRYALAHHLVK